MRMAALGMLGALLCALSPALGARGHHRAAFGSIALGATLALLAALKVLF
jgi:hypothetical protein